MPNDELLLAGGVFLALVLFFGLFKGVVILVIAAGLAAVPQFREILDAFGGSQRERAPLPWTLSSFSSRDSENASVLNSESQKHTTPSRDATAAAAGQLDVPDSLRLALEQLLHLIVRDFVADWYDRYVSLGSNSFPQQARVALNVLVTNLVRRIQHLHRKEAVIYLLSSLSKAMVRQMQGEGHLAESNDVLIGKLRRAAEELLDTTAPPSVLSSPANAALLTEILTLQLWKVVESVDSDFVNTSIIAYLGDDQPSLREQVTEKAQDLVELQNSNQSLPPISRDFDAETHPSAADPMPDNPKQLPPLGDLHALRRCLAGPPDLVEATIVHAYQYYKQNPEPFSDEKVDQPLLTSVLDRSNESMTESFEDYVANLPPATRSRGRQLQRLYGRTTSLRSVIDMQDIEPSQRRQSLLEALIQFMDTLHEEADVTLARSFYACLARLYAGKPDVLEPLQAWIRSELDQEYFLPFLASTETGVGYDLSTPETQPQTSQPSASSTATKQSSTPPVGMSMSNGSEASVSSHSMDFSSINVSLTDISDAPAYDAQSKYVKSKRDLLFLVALELSNGSPGFIIQRSFKEMELLDQSLHKLFPQAGSSTFPRALLPSTAHKTSDTLTRELEGYFNHLLSDHRYAPSSPVQDFFQKERSGPAQPGMSLWDLGRNASRASKTIAKGGENVMHGVGNVLNGFKPAGEMPRFMRLGSAVESALPFQPTDSPRRSGSLDSSRSGYTHLKPDDPANRSSLSVDSQPRRSIEPAAHTVQPKPSNSAPNIPKMHPMHRTSSSSSHGHSKTSKSKREHLEPHQPTRPHHHDTRPVELTAVDLDHIISSALAVLEEAYLLSNNHWSFKRGLLKVIETVVRNSYIGLIGAAFLEGLHTLNAETFATRIDHLRHSFWPSGAWYASSGEQAPERTVKQKEEAKAEAKRLLLAQAPEGLKLALGANATVEALDRLHETLQDDSASRITATVLLDLIRLVLL